ncbi:GNAT family N-acetyltransferase [Streptomyces orinoci]|uniref:GNAT family N-acetyltransferase n=1 Tax=Streptomyces orinoci TaxID=67339 RepID=A0ABV3JW76_STRON|nr:GNAT family N-acetyltransferase [Streptomyces orinoci]
MTTTLRPTAPEQRTEDGGRSRSYDVCVNGRRVGTVDLSTHPRFGPRIGRIAGLAIDERDRHRGRGTVAALAAEEVLRGWGCERIQVSVPAPARAALQLASALGYTEDSQRLAKTLTTAPRLPADSVARPMSREEFPAWQKAELAQYAEHWAERGVPRDRAEAKARQDQAAFLPQGPATPGTVLRVLVHRGTDVGTLWLATRLDGGGYVLSVAVHAGHRGHGHGRTLMLLAERESLAAGARRLALNVFTANTVARRLYESLGYRPTSFTLHKALL